MRRVPYFGATKGSYNLSGLWSMYDHYQRKQKSQWVPNYQSQQWVRPADWLTLPTIASGEEKFVGLFAVFPYGIGTQCGIYVGGGNYTVDWGDGTSPQSYSNGQDAFYTYNFSTISSTTLASEGYKQVIITITPQAGQTLTDVRVSRADSNLDYAQNCEHSWLDINVNFANLSVFQIRQNIGPDMLQRARIGPNQITNFNYMFAGARSLQSVDIYTKNGTIFYWMFHDTRALRVGPNLDLGNATDLNNMFTESGIKTIPPYNLSKAQNVSNMFQSSWIESVPPLTLPSVTNADYMFYDSEIEYIEYIDMPACTSAVGMFAYSKLVSVGTIRAQLVTSMQDWFYSCVKLISVNNIVSTSVTNFQNMFAYCRRLQYVGDFNTSKGTNFTSMFNETWILSKMPTLNLSNATTTNQMFRGSGITMVPDLDISKATDVSYMFQGTSALYKVGNLDCRSATNFDGMFGSYYTVSTVRSIASINTSNATSMNDIFNGAQCLKEVPSGLNTANVTTLQNAFTYSGITICPDLNTSNCTNFQSMFGGADSLQIIGRLDLSKATNLTNFVAGLYTLANVLVYGATVNLEWGASKLSKKNLEIMFKNLGTANAASQTVTISSTTGNANSPTYSKSVTTTAGSNVITLTDTSNLSTGMIVRGTGISDNVAVTFTDSGDIVNLTGHGLNNNVNVSFSNVTTTTGIATYTVYYVANAAANTFQVTSTPGGTAIALTNNGSGKLLYPAFISNIILNTSVTMTAPASASGTVTAAFKNLDTSYATQKGWTVAT